MTMSNVSRILLRRPKESASVVEETDARDELCGCVVVLCDSADGKRNASHVGCTPVEDVSVVVSSLDVPLLCVCVCVDLGVGV